MMGFISSICSAVISIGSSICSGASKLCSAIGPMAMNLGKTLNAALTVISAVVEIIGILKGVLKENEKIEDMGERALQAEEDGNITLESCGNNFDEYKRRMQEHPVDQSKNHSPEQRLAAGILFVQQGLEQKNPQMNLASLYPLMVLNKEYFNAERIGKYVDLAEAGKLNLEKLVKYFEGTCSSTEATEAREFVVNVEKALNPQATDSDIQKETNAIRQEVERKF